MGRLVKTHSTYLEGLISSLEKLALNEEIKTISPGILSRVKGKSENLTLRVTSQIRGGYKVNARKGFMNQEIFILTDLTKKGLEKLIYEVI